MNLHLLRLFYAVVERRGFTRAAEALFISQSAVSKGVRELEHQLGLALLDRGRRGPGSDTQLQLTDAGRSLYAHARSLFALERAADDDMRERRERRRGRLRIGASTTVAGYWLGTPIARFARAHPDIEVSLHVANTDETCRLLIDLELDLAIVEGQVDDARIELRWWRSERLLVVAAPGNGGASKQPVWLLRETGSGTREAALRLLDAHGIRPPRIIEIGSNEAIARAAAEGLGAAILPEAVVIDLVASGCLRELRLGGPRAQRDLSLLLARTRPLPPPAEAFLALL
jgi:DNA-binding transcriptional LysR family regulator